MLLITICVRGGSKGIPGKNIRLINGIPLIAYSLKTAQRFAASQSAVICLSTDSSEIKSIAADFGLTTEYLRPAELATDQAGKIGVIEHLLKHQEDEIGKKFDYVLDLDVTSPLRTVGDLEQAYSMLQKNADALNIFSVNSANRNPYFNMVEQNRNGYYNLVKPGKFLTRQSAPKVYELNASFYIYRRSFFDQGQKSAITDRSLVFVMDHTCFDLDHPNDFEFMDFLISNNKLGFEL